MDLAFCRQISARMGARGRADAFKAANDQIAADYDALWTREPMQRVIDAALRYDVAIEINNRRKIPSLAFIKMAKSAGCKFSFGTNNAEAELGRLEYPIQMVKECGLVWQDIFVPKPGGQKLIQISATQ